MTVTTDAPPLAVPPSEVPRAAGVLPRIPPWLSLIVFTVVIAADVAAHAVGVLQPFASGINGATIPIATAALGATGLAPLANLLTGALSQHSSDVSGLTSQVSANTVKLTKVETQTNGALSQRLADQTAAILTAVDLKLAQQQSHQELVAAMLAAGMPVLRMAPGTPVGATAAPASESEYPDPSSYSDAIAPGA